jgi:hypothetical protein
VFDAVYRDDDPIDIATFDNRDLRITGPNGFVRYARFDRVIDDGADPRRRVVRYKIGALGGAWDALENGTYTVKLRGDGVSDVGHHFAGARTLATFRITVPQPALRASSLASTSFSPSRPHFSPEFDRALELLDL